MYHLTITDKETGKVLEDLDCSIIIAGGDAGKRGNFQIALAGGVNRLDLLAAWTSAKINLDTIAEANPFIKDAIDRGIIDEVSKETVKAARESYKQTTVVVPKKREE
ncbi:MAG: hypothetical protein IJL83_02130 [Clostridia bacterium]|nr:hypothetical protein [Clostridia bacterium]